MLGGLALVGTGVWLAAGPARLQARAPARASATSGTVDTEKVVHYIRERFGVADNVKLTVGPLESSPMPGFYQSMVAVDYGEQNKAQNTKYPILVSKDDRYLVVGNVPPGTALAYTLGANPKAEIEQRIREVFKVPANLQLTVGPFRSSAFPAFNQTEVTAGDGKKKPQSQNFLVSKNERVLVLGQVYALTVDPRREALRTIVTENQPAVGPANAPVTMVEYADLQCPSCAHFHEFIEKELLPKYGDKLRIVFKEFPLPIHDWSGEAAIANECAYQIDPSTYLNYRTLIFARQSSFTVANVRDLLLQYGQEAGLDRLRLEACIDSKSSLPRIEADRREADKLGVNQTPTSFVNGRIVRGQPPPADLFKIIDDALAAKKGKA